MDNPLNPLTRTLFVPASPPFLPGGEIEGQASRRSGTEEHLSVVQAERSPEGVMSELGNSGEDVCRICDGVLHSDNRIRMELCEHQFCRDCLREYIETNVSERRAEDLKCPSFGCEAVLSEDFLKTLLTAEIFQKMLKFKKKNELEKNVNFRWCPRPGCEGYDIASENTIGSGKNRKLTCNLCNFVFCFYCSEAWHGKVKCKSEGDFKLDKWAKIHGAKFCPNCKLRIQKMRGCQHMTCFKCKYQWCWLCGDRYTPEHYYSCPVKHTRRRNPPWKIVLFLLFLPMLCPFLLVLATWFVLEEHISRAPTHTWCDRLIRSRLLSYPLFGLLAMSITPLLLTLFILFAFVAALAELGRYYRYEKNCLGAIARRRCVWILLSLILGISLAPVAASLILLVVALAPIAGSYFLLQKAVIGTIRCCCRPNFMKPNVVPGYDLG